MYNDQYPMIVGSFMDESFDPAQRGVFAVGGLMGRGVATYELWRRWLRLRERPDIDIEYFKASECERGTKQFSKFVKDENNITPQERQKLDAISQEFVGTIAKGDWDKSWLVVHGMGVVQEDFYDVIRDPYARSILGDTPYFLAYHLAMASFSMHDEKRFDVLQAADAIVFEIRRLLNLTLGQWPGQVRKQFRLLSDAQSVHIVQHTNKTNLLKIVELHKPGEPFNLDEIMDTVFHEDIKITI